MNDTIIRSAHGMVDMEFTPSEVSLIQGIWLDSLEKEDPEASNKIAGFFEFQSFIIEDFELKFEAYTGIRFREVTIKGVRVGHVLATHTQTMQTAGILDVQTFDNSADFIKQGTKKGSYQRPPINVEEVNLMLDNLAALNISAQEIEEFKSWISAGKIETKMVIIPGKGPDMDMDPNDPNNPENAAPEDDTFGF